MIAAREALRAVRLTDRELAELGRLEQFVGAVLKEFSGIPPKVEIAVEDVKRDWATVRIDPAGVKSADRLVCLLKYRAEARGWAVSITPDTDAYREKLHGYILCFEPAASGSVALAPAPTDGRGLIASIANELTALVTRSDANAMPSDFALPAAPKLSVIFGTYQRLDHLKQAVASVRKAARGITYEIVTCDGGSTDGSREWLAAQPDIVLVGARHLDGAVKAFNQCFALARGAFIANLNDDCVVEGGTLADGVRYMQEHPEIGQVAFGFRGESEEWHVNAIYPQEDHPSVTWPTTYANFGITRQSAAVAAAEIQGGFWNPIYRTYAADCELSAWIWRLGWRVEALPHLHVTDTRVEDPLREKNTRDSGLEAKRMYLRWPAGAFRPDGPHPNVSAEELARFRLVKERLAIPGGPLPLVATDELRQIVELVGWPESQEERRLRRIAQAIRPLDPVENQFPKRADARTNERVLYVSLATEADPQAGLDRALHALGSSGFKEIRWYADYPDKEARRQAILDAACALRPTLVFAQLQTANAVDAETIHDLRRLVDSQCVIATWNGDIAAENAPGRVDEQVAIGRSVDLVLHSSMSHVHALRAAGIHNAGYLQIGYNQQQYKPDKAAMPVHDICFLGSRYGEDVFSGSLGQHDAKLRDDVVVALKKVLGDRFGLFGRGWKKLLEDHNIATHADTVAPLPVSHLTYQRSCIGLNVSLHNGLDCYTSDRLFRILGCGALLLTKRFPMMSVLGLKHGENCLVWDTAAEAVRAAQDTATSGGFGLIANAGNQLAEKHHTWDVRMLELVPFLEAVRRTAP